MNQKGLIAILVAASVAITAVSLMFGVFFLFFFLPLAFPLAFRRKFTLQRKPTYRRPFTPEENPFDEDDWRKEWK